MVQEERSQRARGRRAKKHAGWLVGGMLAGALSGCMGRALDSTPSANDSASGGSEAVGSGGAGSDTGSGGTVTANGGTMTEEEWQAAIAPRSGPHEIWTYDSCDVPHSGSTSVRVGQESSILPQVGYSSGTDFQGVYYAEIVPYCVTSADCTEEPGGVCQGRASDAYCQYPEPLPREMCETDADCTKKPDGSCVAPDGSEAYRICYPTGVCEDPTSVCNYSGDTPCTGDNDCTERAEGKCIFPVESTNCRYDACHVDADCKGGERCGCGQCVEADCSSDASCPEGETCELSPGVCFTVASFHCTTPLDECTAGEPECFYTGSPEPHWGGGFCNTK